MLQKPFWDRAITDQHLVKTSNYYLYIEDYSRVFGRENLTVLDYTALSADPRSTVNRVCDFLGLPEMETIAAKAYNVTALPKSGFERRLRRLAPALGRTAPEAIKRPVRQILAALRPDKARLTPAERHQIELWTLRIIPVSNGTWFKVVSMEEAALEVSAYLELSSVGADRACAASAARCASRDRRHCSPVPTEVVMADAAYDSDASARRSPGRRPGLDPEQPLRTTISGRRAPLREVPSRIRYRGAASHGNVRKDPATNPRRRSFPRRSVLSEPLRG